MSEREPIRARDVTVVIPCMNEAASLPGVLAAVPPGYRTVVVDNNSTDDTAAVAWAHGASVVWEHVPGYGSAVHAGVLAAQTPVVCVLDGDGSMDPGELPRLVAALDSGADLAVGRRRADRRGTWPLHSRIGNAVLAARLRRRYGLPIHDLGAMRAVRRQDLLDLGVDDRRSGYPLQLLVLAGRAHWRVVERDITYRPRTAGASKVSGSLKGTVVAVHDFWKVIG
ncbi:glycosyltransferase family 2 protein [Rhodococcus opacus]|uniref:glycosyltransferase family 2 protein n=1 Tax=Rhodococcus opacus TaxID=37919 RepID=UPI0018E41F47|nr:glycosyltransferase family 2 protein [Rhodococcus opacus]